MGMIEWCCVAFIAVVLSGLAWSAGPWGCEARWQYSGVQTKWHLQSGCLVEVQPGKFIPERTLRDTTLRP